MPFLQRPALSLGRASHVWKLCLVNIINIINIVHVSKQEPNKVLEHQWSLGTAQ